MMAISSFTLFLAAATLVTANPATLQQHYDAPSHGEHSSHDHSSAHDHDHSDNDAVHHTPHDQSGSVQINADLSASGTSQSNLNEGFVAKSVGDSNTGSGSGLGQAFLNIFGSSNSAQQSGAAIGNEAVKDFSSATKFRDASNQISSSGDSGISFAGAGSSNSVNFAQEVSDSTLTANRLGFADDSTTGSQIGSNVNVGPSQSFSQASRLGGSISDIARIQFESGFNNIGSSAVTVTEEFTVDVFTTVTNLFYNTIPVTLTQFIKTTAVQPTVKVITTPVDNAVFVATAPVTKTDTKTVTDTSTAFQYYTEVSTDIYTITHRAYDIRQQIVTSMIVQTEVFRPTVVSTRIMTEYETQTVSQTVTNTIVIERRVVSTGGVGDRGVEISQNLNSLESFQRFGQNSGSGFGQQFNREGVNLLKVNLRNEDGVREFTATKLMSQLREKSGFSLQLMQNFVRMSDNERAKFVSFLTFEQKENFVSFLKVNRYQVTVPDGMLNNLEDSLKLRKGYF